MGKGEEPGSILIVPGIVGEKIGDGSDAQAAEPGSN